MAEDAPILWLVTISASYYPSSGTDDWVLLTADEEEAWARLRTHRDDYSSEATLVGIWADGRHVEVASRYDDDPPGEVTMHEVVDHGS